MNQIRLTLFVVTFLLSQSLALSLVNSQEIKTSDRFAKQIKVSTTELTISFVDEKVAEMLAKTKPKHLEGMIRVWNAGVDVKEFPSVAGEISFNADKEVVFTPRFPFREGKSYNVVLRWFDNEFKKTVTVPQQSSPLPKLQAIFPTADVLPENLLKFYLHFNVPMQKGDVYRFIQLLNENGKPVELTFLELEQELWSRDSRRLTVLLDPGRIKRGLKPREEVGPIFIPGKKYVLNISGQWPDYRGRKLGKDVNKEFLAGDYDDIQPSIKSWKIAPPKAGTRQPLTIKFPESMDHSMLVRVLRVQQAGVQIDGEITVEQNEKLWIFTPVVDWPNGKHSITVDTSLEDLAGNSIGKMFDVDVFQKPGESLSSKQLTLAFEVN